MVKLNKLASELYDLKACPDARNWVSGYTSRLRAWRECWRGDWMMWYIQKTATPSRPWSSRRKRLLGCLIECFELVINVLHNYRRTIVKRYLTILKGWIAGRRTLQNAQTAVVGLKRQMGLLVNNYHISQAGRYIRSYIIEAHHVDLNEFIHCLISARWHYWHCTSLTINRQHSDIIRKHFPKPPKNRGEGRHATS